jgi:SAM-dependent methyltransferase
MHQLENTRNHSRQFLTNRFTPAILAQEVTMSDQTMYDQKLLREEAYVDDSHLDVRYRTHQLYTVDPVDFGRWTLERLPWRGGKRVLDVGCGPGDLLCEMARQHQGWQVLVGLDASPGMIAKAAWSARGLPAYFFVGDAQALSFPDGSFDVVMARHMLYHVPDIDRAVAEAARVLRPGGHFLAVTNSANTMPEYWELRQRAKACFPNAVLPQKCPDRFSVENAGLFLSPHFENLETHTLTGTLRFPTAQPLVDYFASSRALTMQPGHTDADWQAVLDFVHSEVETVIAREGRFDVTKVAGAVVGVKGG